MQHKTKPLLFTFQLKALKIPQVYLYFFSRALHFPFSLFLRSICQLFKRTEPLFFLTHIPQAFLFIPTKHRILKALIRVNFYFWLVEALEIEVIVCCPVTSVVFYFIILYLFFWCRTPRRWVNPSEWNHNAPHFRNIHRGWLILRIFSHHLRLLLLISVNL